MTLPSNLDEIALIRFDRLLLEGKLHYSHSEQERIEDNGFLFEFRICPVLRKKPNGVGTNPVRSKGLSPFVNPDPEFIISRIGPLHTLILNKYCACRPSYILHTNEYASQSNDLDEADIAATWVALGSLKTPQLVIFNCGVEAGASQSHKHLQLLPRPTQPFKFFPEGHELSLTDPQSIPGIPYKHFVIGIPVGANASDVAKRHHLLLSTMRKSLEASSFAAYNVVLVEKWILLVPRRRAIKGAVSANGAGMMGWVWVGDADERNNWTRLGMTRVLAYMGVPSNE